MTDRRKLKTVLTVAAIGLGLSIFGVVLPWSWVVEWMRFCGAETLPPHPAVMYAVRVGCAGAFFVGVFFAMVARDPHRFAPFVDLGIAGLLLVGLVCLIVGITTPMPTIWWVGDVAFCWVLGILMAKWRGPSGAF